MLWRHGPSTVLHTFLTVARDHLPVPARPAHIAATPVVVARIVAIGMAIRKGAPESHEHRRCEDRRDQRNLNSGRAHHQYATAGLPPPAQSPPSPQPCPPP